MVEEIITYLALIASMLEVIITYIVLIAPMLEGIVTYIALIVPMLERIVTYIALIVSVVSLIVACFAYRLQKKADQDLKRVEVNIARSEDNINQISQVQDKIAFETEKNRLMFYVENATLPNEVKKNIKIDINHIFNEKKFRFSLESKKESQTTFDTTDTTDTIEVSFIKESTKPYALPKMTYPFQRIHDFPYFCVQIIKGNEGYKIFEGEFYYLTYYFRDPVSWCIGQGNPIDSKEYNKTNIEFVGYHFNSEGGLPADEFCKSSSLS